MNCQNLIETPCGIKFVFIVAVLIIAGAIAPTYAQNVPPIPPQTGPLPAQPPKLPEAPPPVQPPPLEEPAPRPPAPTGVPITAPKILVKGIQVVGNTAFTFSQLAGVTAPFVDRELTAEDLEALRLAITYYYINHGYVTSGAVIPEQTVTDGILTVQVIEGKLTEINLEGTDWFRPSYFKDRIETAVGPPLNVNTLQERLQLLQADPRIERMNAELRPGLGRGDSLLNLRVTEANPLKAWLEFNNFQSPLVGAEQGFITLAHRNLFGLGDQLSLQYGRSAGVNPILNFRYAIPVNRYDTTVAVQYRRFNFAVKESPFDALDIENNAQIFGISVRQPVYRRIDRELALSLIAEHEQNESFLGGQPQELVLGSPNGIFKVTAFRFAQEYSQRSSHQVISLLSRLSVGVGINATANADPNLPDARFFSWLGEAQYLRQLPFWRSQLFSRGLIQLSHDHLFPLEQMAVGGRYSVRGYREFTLIRDNAAIGTVELRVPVYATKAGVDTLFVVPFFDIGHGWDTTVPTPDTPPKTLASLGLGAIWNFWRGSRFEIYWGKQLNHFDTNRGNLQDHGVHLQLVVEAF